MPERLQMYGRRLTPQQKDERQQDNGDKKRLVCQHLSNLLHSLTCERDRRRTAWHHLNSALSFAISANRTNMVHVRHMMRMHIPSIPVCGVVVLHIGILTPMCKITII